MDAVNSVEAEATKEHELFSKLQEITDENGNVKAGYEERAKYILGELSTALGQEYGLTEIRYRTTKICVTVLTT